MRSNDLVLYQLDITESPSWNDFVHSVYQWEDLLEESNNLQLNWNESKYDPVTLFKKVSKCRGEGRSFKNKNLSIVIF